LTSKLDLLEVLQDAIKPYAFYASEYPLILSIENHCSKKQQDRMASHFKSVLGDLLCTQSPDIDGKALPSPQQLRRRILVKAKRQLSSEDTAAASASASSVSSEPQLQPSLNEASSQLLEKTAIKAAAAVTTGAASKMIKNRSSTKMQQRSASLSIIRAKSERNNNHSG
jgi:hypothetical protein